MLLAVAAVLALLAPPPVYAPSRGAEAPGSPAVRVIRLGLRLAAGPDDALVGGGARVYRAEPEILLAMHPAAGLDLLAGVGLGGAVVVRPPREGVDLTMSGTLGLRFPVEGANLLATARAEAVAGSGAAFTLHLEVSFDRGP